MSQPHGQFHEKRFYDGSLDAASDSASLNKHFSAEERFS
jgi:hypothetical protein